MMKKILFRADGNAIIGAGHIMRCLSIALAAKKIGVQCYFITADDSFSERIEENNIEHIVLDSDYSQMDLEWEKSESIIQKIMPDVIVLDSYYVTKRYISKLCEYGRVAYIDDLKAFPYNVDVLVNYNVYAKDLNYHDFYFAQGKRTPELVLGETYVPLRTEFQNISLKGNCTTVKNILFMSGGADPERIAIGFVKELINNQERIEKYKFHIVLGKYEPDAEEIIQLSKQYSWMCVHRDVRQMAELMLQCDIAISAAGSTLYELCVCAVPTITYVLEDNQIMGANAFAEKKIMLCVGDYRFEDNFFEKMFAILLELCFDEKGRQQMSKNARAAVDGNGAMRLVNKLLA